jgi:hypothetical protein
MKRPSAAIHPMSRRIVVPLLAAGLVAFGLSSCVSISSTYTYVSHRNPDSTEMYFKVPSSWKIFDAKQIVQAANGPISQSQINAIEAGQWLTAFSASPHATAPKTPINQLSQYPNGIVFAHELSASDRDALNFSTMRAFILGTDPLEAPTSSVTPQYDVQYYNDQTAGPGGIRESTLTTLISEPDGATSEFSQIIAVDPLTEWIYGIGISCTDLCWGPNQGVIKQILNSWNLKETK